jgi:putative membrane protein insertion efficiency factor
MNAREALSRVAKVLLKAPILAYRHVISPWLGPNCRFQPTCSAYALEAIEKHGALRGGWLTLRRLSKCHPISWLGGSYGYDPCLMPAAPPHIPIHTTLRPVDTNEQR